MTKYFIAERWRIVQGHRVAVVRLDRDYKREDILEEFQRERIEIDGQPFEVIGVEAFKTAIQPKGQRVGLLLKNPPKQTFQPTVGSAVHNMLKRRGS